MCQLVNIDTDNRNKIIDTMIQVRIFRNSKDIYYKIQYMSSWLLNLVSILCKNALICR